MMVGFNNREAGREWLAQVEEIKLHIRVINESGSREEDYQAWLGRVMEFRQRWGDPLVPFDVKEAVHSVQDGLGMARTVWQG